MVYRLAPDWQPTLAVVDTALATQPFAECGATQPRSIGWVSPRGDDHGALVEAIDGQWLLQLMVESKLVPGSVVKRQVETLAAQIEKTTGRKPGKKETRELKDQALAHDYHLLIKPVLPNKLRAMIAFKLGMR